MAYERFIKYLKNNDATFNLLKEKADNSKLKEDKDMLEKYIMSEKEKIIKRNHLWRRTDGRLTRQGLKQVSWKCSKS